MPAPRPTSRTAAATQMAIRAIFRFFAMGLSDLAETALSAEVRFPLLLRGAFFPAAEAVCRADRGLENLPWLMMPSPIFSAAKAARVCGINRCYCITIQKKCNVLLRWKRATAAF